MDTILFNSNDLVAPMLPIQERIKSYEDACKHLGISEVKLSITGMDKHTKSIVANLKLITIIEALNEGWEADWTDKKQRKYTPYFEHKSGFGLAYDAIVGWDTRTDVGSRLCLKSEELSKYASTQFADLYNDYLSK